MIVPEGNVPKGFADLGQVPQVMMLMHQFLIALFFDSPNRPDKDFPQVQSNLPPAEV